MNCKLFAPQTPQFWAGLFHSRGQNWQRSPEPLTEWRDRVNRLSLEQLENLGEALLDFQGIGDLETWWDTSEEN